MRLTGNERWQKASRRAMLVVAVAIATVALTAVTLLLVPGLSKPGAAQALSGSPAALPRVADRPDFSGIWQANNTANWDLQAHAPRPMVGQPGFLPNSVVLAAPVVALGAAGWSPGGLGVVQGEEIPYQPWAAKRKQENLANWVDRDPELKCFQPGVPRAMYIPHPYQIVQSHTKMNFVFEFANAERTIHLTKMDPYPNVGFMGYSTGRWEGDTLVAESSLFTDATWFDRAGNFHSDALEVTERFIPMTRDAFRYEATIEDPQVFTRPWTISMPMYRRLEPNVQLVDFRCVPMVEETMYGHLRKEQLVKTWSGTTMTVDVTRKIPPGEEVHERYISGNPPPPAN